jgi:hypothetical protein
MSKSIDRHRMRQLHELLGGEVFMNPEVLADLDRKLTPEEQKIVSDWQSKQADAMLTAERAKGGPQSRTVTVTEKGAIIERPRTVQDDGWSWWKIALGVLGVGAIGWGVTHLGD